MNWRLFFGVILVFVSLLIGKITTVTFILYINDKIGRYLSLIIYILTWPMLIIGVYICGVEGAEYLRKIYQFFSYRYYHDHVRNHVHKRREHLRSIFRRKE